jgi:uncharacterized protein involved in exopolysaccharide biosynthesis
MAEAAAGALPHREASSLQLEGDSNHNESLERDSAYLQAQYDALSRRYQAGYPKMVALRHDIERQKTTEDAEHARVENLKTQIALADREIKQRSTERDGILKAITQYQARVEQLPVREQEMAELTRDYEISKTNYKSLLDKKIAASMATDMERRQEGERFTMLDPPMVPEKPVSPKRPLLIGLGCVLSLALALAFPIAEETKRNTVLGEWELPEGLNVLGRVPFIEHDSQSPAEAGGEQKRQRWKWALISSLLLSILVTCAAGVYLYWGQR